MLTTQRNTAVLAGSTLTVQPRPQQVHTVMVRGPVPERGPMTYTNDSAHLNISFVPPPGTVLESGRNKIELVLQTRSASIDSDLAWSDVQTLASSLALPPGAVVESTPGSVITRGAGADARAQPVRREGPERADHRHAQRQPGRAAAVRGPHRVAGRRRALPASPAPRPSARCSSTASLGLQGQVAHSELFDPVIWQASVVVPAFSGKGRLVLREFERYYTDRTVPDKRGSVTYRKRVVEERLVYSEFFPLN